MNTIHEIEEARKKGLKIKRVRSPTPKKQIHSHVCKKFKGDPNKFFSKNLPNSLLKTFNIALQNSAFKSVKSTGNFWGNMSNKEYNSKKLIKSSTTDQLEKSNKNKSINNNNYKKNNNSKNNKKTLNEFNLDSNNSKKNEKEKALKNIINNVNLKESMINLEKESNIMRDTEDFDDELENSLHSYVETPEVGKK